MGLLDRVEAELAADPPPERDAIDGAFWAACHGGQLATAQRLLAAGADISWVAPWDGLTPLDSGAAQRLRRGGHVAGGGRLAGRPGRAAGQRAPLTGRLRPDPLSP